MSCTLSTLATLWIKAVRGDPPNFPIFMVAITELQNLCTATNLRIKIIMKCQKLLTLKEIMRNKITVSVNQNTATCHPNHEIKQRTGAAKKCLYSQMYMQSAPRRLKHPSECTDDKKPIQEDCTAIIANKKCTGRGESTCTRDLFHETCVGKNCIANTAKVAALKGAASSFEHRERGLLASRILTGQKLVWREALFFFIFSIIIIMQCTWAVKATATLNLGPMGYVERSRLRHNRCAPT